MPVCSVVKLYGLGLYNDPGSVAWLSSLERVWVKFGLSRETFGPST